MLLGLLLLAEIPTAHCCSGTEESKAATGFPVDGWTNSKTLKKHELIIAEGMCSAVVRQLAVASFALLQCVSSLNISKG